MGSGSLSLPTETRAPCQNGSTTVRFYCITFSKALHLVKGQREIKESEERALHGGLKKLFLKWGTEKRKMSDTNAGTSSHRALVKLLSQEVGILLKSHHFHKGESFTVSIHL